MAAIDVEWVVTYVYDIVPQKQQIQAPRGPGVYGIR